MVSFKKRPAPFEFFKIIFSSSEKNSKMGLSLLSGGIFNAEIKKQFSDLLRSFYYTIFSSKTMALSSLHIIFTTPPLQKPKKLLPVPL